MFQQGEITVDEADALLVMEYKTRHLYKGHHPRIDFPEKINLRTVRIAHLYTKMYLFIRNCMETCGLYKYTVSSNRSNDIRFLFTIWQIIRFRLQCHDYVMFDGRYFHQTLEEINSSPAQKRAALRHVWNDRIYID